MTGGEANDGIGMEHARLGKPSLAEGESACPGEPVLLAAAAKSTPLRGWPVKLPFSPPEVNAYLFQSLIVSILR